MKFEIEINEDDWKDRQILAHLRQLMLKQFEKLSAFGKNTLNNSPDRILESIEWAENLWIRTQKERVVNLFCEKMNIEVSKFSGFYEEEDES